MTTLKEKVQSMTSAEIIWAMVEGLEDPACEVDMTTYLNANTGLRSYCFGCAATQTICKISGIERITPEQASGKPSIFELMPSEKEAHHRGSFVDKFETAIDGLRRGRIDYYNNFTEDLGIAKIKSKIPLPELTSEDYEENLHHYKLLAVLEDRERKLDLPEELREQASVLQEA